MDQEELSILLDRHEAWLERGDGVARYCLVLYPETDASGLDFSGRDLSRAKIYRSNLRGANLAGTRLASARIWEADLRSVSGPNLDISGADCRKSDFRGAKLRRFNGRGAKLEKVRFHRADIRDGDMRGAVTDDAELDEGTRVNGLWLTEQILSTLKIPGSIREFKRKGIKT